MNKILHIILISLFSLTIISCAKTSSDDSKTTTDDTTTSDDDTTTTTTTTTTTDTVTGVIYQAISVKKKPKKPSIKYTSLTAKPTTTNLNFDNAQFGNVKFQQKRNYEEKHTDRTDIHFVVLPNKFNGC